MSIFRGLDKAEVTGGSQYFLPGSYRVKVEAAKIIQSKKSGSAFFVIECEVLESDNSERRPGTRCSQTIKMGEVMSLPNVKKFIAAATGCDPTAKDVNERVCATFSDATGRRMSIEDVAEYVVSDENPLGEVEMVLNCYEIETKRGTPFTKHDWASV